MHDARIAPQLFGNVQPRMPGREQHMAEDAVRVQLEATVDRAHPLDPRALQALLPPTPRAQLVDV